MIAAYWHAGVFWCCFPWVLAQAWWLRRSARTLPGAPGPGLGQISSPVKFRVLGLGDSIIDGVGTAHRSQSLTAQIALHASEQLARNQPANSAVGVSWHALGRSGYTTGKVASKLLPELAPNPYDLVVISVGVNDVTALVGLRQFGKDLKALDHRLKDHSPLAQVVLLGAPPMWHFPRLPQPLRWVIGQRARAFQAAGKVFAQRLGWDFHSNNFAPSAEDFAEDGYHPNAASVSRWAEQIAALIRRPETLQ